MSDEFKDRSRKRDELREMGVNPYPARFETKDSMQDCVGYAADKKLDDVEVILERGLEVTHTVRGRIMTFREHGKLSFASLQDESGRLQICFMENSLGKETYKLLRKFDIGDFLGAEGELFITRHGELTLLVKNFTFLGKTLRPLPEKWHGLQDKEAKYRHRYLDLISSEDSMSRFRLRSAFIKSMREYLDSHAFTEVETPVLSGKASGAMARPFRTHHQALDLDVYLRIAPELYLKRCVAAGFERVYEFAKCFRNEGMDPSHLQEFTMLEYYAAYWNYEDNMQFTEEMLKSVIQKLFGTLQIDVMGRDGAMVKVDFSAPWPRLDFAEMIEKDCGVRIFDHAENADSLRKAIRKAGIEIEDSEKQGFGNLCDSLYKKVSRPKLISPCFVIHHPASTKPLARRSDARPEVCETFQLLVNTWELVNAYSEIVDPADQWERFFEQALAQAGGDEEAMEVDIDYMRCMEHGMPPISGWGMGVDRILTVLTGRDNLRDLVLFPLMKPSDEDIKAEKKFREKVKKRSRSGAALNSQIYPA